MPPNPNVLRPQNNPAPTTEPRGLGSMIFSMISYFLAPATPSDPSVAASVPPRPSGRLTGQNCVICQDPIRGEQVRAPCGHYYDIACAKELFEAATRDESLFPPRCCRTEISFAYVRPHLTAAIATLFTEKQTELATPNRVYCAKPSCSRFLGPRSTGFFAWPLDCPAPGCKTRTCPSCKGEMGPGRHECKVDETDEQILALGRTAGWARCPRCAAMIELNLGCFHMTCRCRAEFCYLCTARWKTCACTQWDETRLVAAAEERVAQRFGPVAAARPNQIVRPVQRPQELRVEPIRRAAPPAAPPAAPLAAVPLRRTLAYAAPLAAPTGRRAVPPPAAAAPIFNPAPIRRTEGNAANVVPGGLRANPPTATRQPAFHGATAATEAASALREHRIREAMEELRVNHDCSHTKWKYRAGGGPCQTCAHRLPHYLFRCVGCQTLACNRCRRNRL
ncbi:hypothetical protein FIBSPDRAFT_809975 [Athelia psychrophila]|uniref:RING-type domain-containing protein n=1 Tax=Athelia psychrophila TaxID=1759441 RepID=A0A166XBC9_9AGAM|nr:hypothetical protein FIBSPDRAFT_809975 [Fibularhizoctonia sp. CBS 109695]